MWLLLSMFFAFCCTLLVFGLGWLVLFEKCDNPAGCSDSLVASFFFGAAVLPSVVYSFFLTLVVVLPGVALWAALTFPSLAFQWALIKRLRGGDCMMCGAYHDPHAIQPLLAAETDTSASVTV